MGKTTPFSYPFLFFRQMQSFFFVVSVHGQRPSLSISHFNLHICYLHEKINTKMNK